MIAAISSPVVSGPSAAGSPDFSRAISRSSQKIVSSSAARSSTGSMTATGLPLRVIV